ncbi:Oxidoreductase molybdopterin binding domain-containing protein [Pseudoxanthomonas sp. GM95]|uniref:molybdopterin-dependent oxidoreductase n=1 Tax=Pseudoxanthomonas sp. GM95 TaxID=1881043 RepID=UPI0008B1677A|nr:molybdopterin-dependent oxidoreductase [Pseudoxanthomonas sp. GM95]SEL71163.1 Oxidoreductase molybdopterin binding domain-containing protein [Pseudoxanthomonas sp. GM95]
MKAFAVLLLAALSALPAVSAFAASDDAAISVPLDAAALRDLPRQRAQMDVHGQALDCSGVALAALLQKAQAMPATPLRGPQLARVVEVQAADGYRVVFSLGELDATLGKAQVVLADQCAGKPLDAHDGPLRLLVPGDGRPARSVRQVNRITVRTP